jgi:hypothetical protein
MSVLSLFKGQFWPKVPFFGFGGSPRQLCGAIFTAKDTAKHTALLSSFIHSIVSALVQTAVTETTTAGSLLVGWKQPMTS